MRQCASTSSAVSDGSRRTTNTLIRSPCTSSGMPIAAASLMPGCITSTSSISFGYTLKPDTRIMSFLRSMRRMKPRSSITPMSPVPSQPSASITLAVSSGRCQ
ncbi:hypothetical protein BA763_11930 [Burkholderia cenocepacia]|nr:hypothetical protein BA763_11930 [Burkholderia cenocepacia]